MAKNDNSIRTMPAPIYGIAGAIPEERSENDDDVHGESKNKMMTMR